MTAKEMASRIAELEAQIAKKNAASGNFSIGKKGGVSVKVEGSWPVTLTAARWRYILSQGPAILAFIDANKALLVGEGAPAPAATV